MSYFGKLGGLIAPALCLFSIACGSGSTSAPPSPSAPVFTSTAPANAQEGSTWSYTPNASDPDGGSVAFTLTNAPSGAALNGSTVSWTPTHAQSRTDNSFSITATTSEGGIARQTFKITPTGNIHATVIDHMITGNGIELAPEDLAHRTIEALVPDLRGGYIVQAGVGDTNGNLTVPNIPAGNFWLHLQTLRSAGAYISIPADDYIWTSSSDLDLGSLRQGRADVSLLTAPVTVNPNVNLTVAPQANDTIQWSSPDAGAVGVIAPVSQSPFTTQLSQPPGGTIDASRGDRAYLLHYSGGLGLSPNRAVLQELLEDDSVQEVSGGTVTLNGTMSVPATYPAHPVINFSQFDALIPSGLTTWPLMKEFVIEDPLYIGDEGIAGGIPTYRVIFDPAAADTDLGDISFALVDRSAAPAVLFGDNTAREYSFNGTRVIVGNLGSILHTASLPSAEKPLVPVLSPPLSPKIDGLDFLSDQTVSLTPTITWDAPTMGKPESYRVTIIDFGSSGTPARLAQTWTFLTSDTSVMVPTGLMQAGDPFVIILAANSSPGTSFASAPFRHTSEYSSAMVGSGLMTVAGAPSMSRRANTTLLRTLRVEMDVNGRWAVAPMRNPR